MPNKAKKTQQITKVTCVFVHGWGMNSAVWDTCLPLLPPWMDVICLDLPGHGSMNDVPATGLQDYVRVLSSVVERPVVWVGWSLGGLALMQLAHYFPERVAAMFLVASNPCFVKQAGWSTAIDRKVFEQFSVSLEQDIEGTVRRFLALQVKGGQAAMSTVRELQRAISSRGHASVNALRLGLEILSSSDLRDELCGIRRPLKYYLGERDTLVPAELASELLNLNPYVDVEVVEAAAHAPFVSQPDAFVKSLVRFVEGVK